MKFTIFALKKFYLEATKPKWSTQFSYVCQQYQKQGEVACKIRKQVDINSAFF